MTKNKYLSLLYLLTITFSASIIGGFVSAKFKEPWYSQILLPEFSPPSWVFAPVWTSLYILMSIAAWKVWQTDYNKKNLTIYLIHLFFNALWSVIFFGFHQITLALIDLIIILSFIIILMRIYYDKNRFAFILFLPYFLWSSFALVLNFTIYLIN